MRKIITLLTTAFLLTATTALAQGPWNVGSYWGADNVIATFSNGTLTFTGEGKMTDFDDGHSSFCAPWKSIREQITSVVIDKRITSIGDDAFNGCVNLTGSLPFHEGITWIGSGAFKNCSNLTGTLAIPQSVTTIRSSAFENCSGLTGDLIIPEGVTEISFYTFSGCSGLNGILSIPAEVKTIFPYAFAECEGLTGTLTLPEKITEIHRYAFAGCEGLTSSLIIPKGVTLIGEAAFAYCCGLTGSLTIPQSVTKIDNYAFIDCSGFTSISNYATTPQTINRNVFSGLTLSNITLNVPAASLALYQDAAVWKDFNVAGNLTSVDEVSTGDAVVVAYYSILGVKLSQEPQSGNYIVVYNNGKTEKRMK